MDSGKLIYEIVESEGRVHNLTRENRELKKKVAALKELLNECSSKAHLLK